MIWLHRHKPTPSAEPPALLPESKPMRVTVWDGAGGADVTEATLQFENPSWPLVPALVDENDHARLLFVCSPVFGVEAVYGWGVHLAITARGGEVFRSRVMFAADADLSLPPRVFLPSAPSRDQLGTVRMHFQGATLRTVWSPNTPWFQIALGWLPDEAAQRDALQQLRGLNDTHIALAVTGQYDEPRQFYAGIKGRDFYQDLPAFRRLVGLGLDAGMTGVVVHLGMDGQSIPGQRYNVPEGLTIGFDNGMADMPRVADALQDVHDRLIIVPGFDGIVGYDEKTQVVGPWSFEQVNRWLRRARQLFPASLLMIEPSMGPLGGTLPSFLAPDAFAELDGVLHELHLPPEDDLNWQQADRALGPAWRRPADMPAGDDDAPPWYWPPSPRGRRFAVRYESGLYEKVREQVTDQALEAQRQAHRAWGYGCWG